MGISSVTGTLPGMGKDSRIELARRRARAAKTVVGALSVLVFGVAFVGAKMHAPGHAKGKATPLGAPSSFERKVRSSVTQGGQIAPAVQPPPVATSTS
jgi:hypothetical protein